MQPAAVHYDDAHARPASALSVWLPAGLLAAGTGAAALAIAPAGVALSLFAVLAWFAVPGVRLAARCYRDGSVRWLVGPIWGYLLSCLALLLLWWAGLRRPLAVAIAPALAWAAVALLGPRRPFLEGPSLTRRDLVAALLVLCLVPAMVGRPFSQVGRAVPDGVAYRAYFTADFIWARTVVVELAKGDQPPHNMFLRGDALNYYWLPHLLSAAEYRAGLRALTADRVLLVNGLGLGVMFVAFLYGFLRHFTRSAAAAAIAGAFALAFVSVEAVWFLLREWRAGRPLGGILAMNVDGITRWVLGTVLVDGLQRLLMYQPTHHAVTYAAGLSALLAAMTADRPGRPAAAWLAGMLLGGGLLFSSFSAAMIGLAVALYYLGRLAAAGEIARIPATTLRGALPVAAAVGTAVALRYVDPRGGLVDIGLNRLAVRNASLAVPLSFGLLLPTGIAGIVIGLFIRTRAAAALAVLGAVCSFSYFFVNVLDHQDVYVAWRAGHILIIVLAAGLAIFWEWAWPAGRVARAALVTAAALGALLAAPTTALDLYTAQDIGNRAYGPGFRWTVILHRGELEGLAWLREHTAPDAIVQVEPFVRGRDTWSYVTAFAERRMAAGLPISMVPLAKYERASERIRAIYRAADAAEAYDRAARERIDYLVVGAPERQAYPQLEPALDRRPDLFVPVFRNGEMTIYRLRGSRR
ncbi:MAG TPA: hypothetical protein VNI83_00455 [Vicinamibacterales bacterium]|nr:hypothetical protein [Vicinamibacterales bacterium]